MDFELEIFLGQRLPTENCLKILEWVYQANVKCSSETLTNMHSPEFL